MTFQVTKTFGHDLGISACFRQWRANSHCRFLHGYALSFSFVFEADTLDARNWVVDFGGLKALKQHLLDTFDHKTLVAANDPMKDELWMLNVNGLADVVILDAVGCEAFAETAYWLAVAVINEAQIDDRVRVVSCEVSEHGANSAKYIRN